MLFAEAMRPASTRSSLEVMLDAIRRKDEHPEDLPPALPARPTSRGRLPTSRKPLPVTFARQSNGEEMNLGSSDRGVEVKEDSEQKNGVSGGMGFVGKSPDLRVNCKCRSASLAVNLSGHFKSGEALDYFLKEKLQVWCWLPEEKWECGKIESFSPDDAYVLMSNGKILRLPFEHILPANPEIHDSVNDIALLSYINEPSVLHSLKYRYSQNIFSTKAGAVLVALNPCKELSPHKIISGTACRRKVRECPHVFAMANQAYGAILSGGKNQSIIVSGESGSGKTEATKIAMQCAVAIASSDGIGVEILKANAILESFGNSKTSKNNNSSCFSKLNVIHFSQAGRVCGAEIKTFLLEKSRVVQRAVGERSYHVFYQLCAGAPPRLKEKLNLKSANEYEFLKQSKCLRVDNIDDAREFHLLMEALDNFHITKEDQDSVFSMLAAVLWLGNIGFSIVTSENHVEVNLDEAVTNVATLLGCEINTLLLALSTRRSHSGDGTIVQKLTLSQAIESRDALAKSIYCTLFDWIAALINKSLQVGKTHTGSSISFLDICGFEFSHKNGFEQFCRNYANERILQFIVSHLLKREQEEYTIEGLNWSKIEFADNDDCINLYEKVLYNTSYFLDNNRDILHEDFIKLLLSCSNQLSKVLASFISISFPMQSACKELKDQLSELTQLLENTNPHFIRCINPNRKQLAGIYEEDFVIHQLRSSRLLEVARIARSSYPTRMTFLQFAERYKSLLMENTAALDPLSISVAVLQRHNAIPGMYQVGYTKIFLRNGQLAVLEAAKARALQGILYTQKYFCGARARRIFMDIKKGAATLQSFIRAEGTRREFQYLVRRHRAAVLIQKNVKQWVVRKAFAKQQEHIVLLQSVIRSWLAKKHLNLSKNLETTKCRNIVFEGDQNKLHEQKNTQQEHSPVDPSDMADLKNRVLKAEAEMRDMEEENLDLRKQLQQYEMRWSGYDLKMKSMEEMWQKQMSSLQMSLAAAKRSHGTNDVANLMGKPDPPSTSPYFDYEDTMSVETYTTEGTPAMRSRAGTELNSTPDVLRNTVTDLVKEFEEQRRIFEDDAGFIVEVKSGVSISNINPDEEFRKLKSMFASWKKSYVVRLRETKKALRKFRTSGAAKTRRRWWCTGTSK
ncbi:hypothetical protein KSP39_PZI021372 [Platanthera zijinensis]|uniref:Uncharacterized protein n=1 Tax=Platanthera zijinensis TaxID=2320716 RepID=A0AAP0FVL7_9ASPA